MDSLVELQNIDHCNTGRKLNSHITKSNATSTEEGSVEENSSANLKSKVILHECFLQDVDQEVSSTTEGYEENLTNSLVETSDNHATTNKNAHSAKSLHSKLLKNVKPQYSIKNKSVNFAESSLHSKLLKNSNFFKHKSQQQNNGPFKNVNNFSKMSISCEQRSQVSYLECAKCNILFTKTAELARHIRFHQLQCTQCLLTLQSELSHFIHLHLQCPKNPYSCNHCCLNFKKQECFLHHKNKCLVAEQLSVRSHCLECPNCYNNSAIQHYLQSDQLTEEQKETITSTTDNIESSVNENEVSSPSSSHKTFSADLSTNTDIIASQSYQKKNEMDKAFCYEVEAPDCVDDVLNKDNNTLVDPKASTVMHSASVPDNSKDLILDSSLSATIDECEDSRNQIKKNEMFPVTQTSMNCSQSKVVDGNEKVLKSALEVSPDMNSTDSNITSVSNGKNMYEPASCFDSKQNEHLSNSFKLNTNVTSMSDISESPSFSIKEVNDIEFPTIESSSKNSQNLSDEGDIDMTDIQNSITSKPPENNIFNEQNVIDEMLPSANVEQSQNQESFINKLSVTNNSHDVNTSDEAEMCKNAESLSSKLSLCDKSKTFNSFSDDLQKNIKSSIDKMPTNISIGNLLSMEKLYSSDTVMKEKIGTSLEQMHLFDSKNDATLTLYKDSKQLQESLINKQNMNVAPTADADSIGDLKALNCSSTVENVSHSDVEIEHFSPNDKMNENDVNLHILTKSNVPNLALSSSKAKTEDVIGLPAAESLTAMMSELCGNIEIPTPSNVDTKQSLHSSVDKIFVNTSPSASSITKEPSCLDSESIDSSAQNSVENLNHLKVISDVPNILHKDKNQIPEFSSDKPSVNVAFNSQVDIEVKGLINSSPVKNCLQSNIDKKQVSCDKNIKDSATYVADTINISPNSNVMNIALLSCNVEIEGTHPAAVENTICTSQCSEESNEAISFLHKLRMQDKKYSN